MAEAHVIGALRNKRSELAGLVNRLEQELVDRRASLTHLDATMRLFDPDIRPEGIRPRRRRDRSVWFRSGECLRLIHDVLRELRSHWRRETLLIGSCTRKRSRPPMTGSAR